MQPSNTKKKSIYQPCTLLQPVFFVGVAQSSATTEVVFHSTNKEKKKKHKPKNNSSSPYNTGGSCEPFNIYGVWFAEGVARAQLHHSQGCTWRYSATLHWRNYSPACVLLGQKKSPILLACPASHFLECNGCCSASNSCAAGLWESFKQRRDRSTIPQL